MFLNGSGWANSTGGSSGGDITIVGNTNSILNTVAEMNSISSPKSGDICHVTSTKELYMYKDNSWTIIPMGTGSYDDLINKPQSSANAIDSAVDKAHEHIFDEVVLNKLTDVDGDLQYNGKSVTNSITWESFNI